MDDPQWNSKQVIRLIADGTGRSEEEFKLLVATTVVTGVLAAVAAVYVGVVRFREFLRDA
ncbi:MAG TPA: hypothetical protein VNQ53_08025 [Nocardioides sp.]|nr:hypothetical protein [Nocardioides sp.]